MAVRMAAQADRANLLEQEAIMEIYESAGEFYTYEALERDTRNEAHADWDEATMGSFRFNFSDYLTESIQTGTIKAVEVNE